MAGESCPAQVHLEVLCPGLCEWLPSGRFGVARVYIDTSLGTRQGGVKPPYT